MLKKTLIGLLVVLGGFAVFVASRPATFRVERSATMAAPADIPYALLSDFHRWGEWSPWDKLDPKQQKTFEGAGVGATYAWAGNEQVGKGRMTLTEARPGESVTIKLEFLEPWAATNTTTFKLATAAEATTVTWAMEGQYDFMGKAFSLFMDMDKSVGADFEKGLAAMKGLAEAEAQKRAAEKVAAEKAAAEKAAAEQQAAQGAP